MDQFNWICPALPFADASILSREGEQELAVDHTDIYKSLKDSLGNKNLKVGHINVNGIINKLNEVHVLLNEVKWDILGITETHLTASTPDNLLRIPGYDFVRKDRSTELDAVWINVTLRSQSSLIGCLYRPPIDMTFFSSLQGLLNEIWVKRKNVVLIGDLNSNLLPASNQDQDLSLCGTKLQRILNIFGYLNVIKSPTRITKNSTSLLDLVITNPYLNCLKSGSLDLGISDHHLVYGVFALTKSKLKAKIAFVEDYKSLDLNELKADMARAPWHVIGALEDIDDGVFV